jgi:hypothetical protein
VAGWGVSVLADDMLPVTLEILVNTLIYYMFSQISRTLYILVTQPSVATTVALSADVRKKRCGRPDALSSVPWEGSRAACRFNPEPLGLAQTLPICNGAGCSQVEGFLYFKILGGHQ